MRITKFGHACVRIEHDGTTVVIDPGMFTDPDAVDGADVVLLTHEHPDHVDAGNLRAADAPILTIAGVAESLRGSAPDLVERIQVVEPGESFEVGDGVPVTAVGELHAVIHRDLPRITNSGFLLTLTDDGGDQRVYHPGDALTVPDAELGAVDVLLAPSSAPWMRLEQAIDFVRDVGAPRNLSIHDAIYTEAAHGIVAMQMEHLLPDTQTWTRIGVGEDLG